MNSRKLLGSITKLTFRLAVVLLTASLLPLPIGGAPIVCTFTATGSGFVDATAFADTEFTIEVVGDTDNVALENDPYFTIWNLPASSATMDIAGIGLATFTTDKRVFVNQNYRGTGFSQSGGDLLDLYDASFADYDLKSSFGPILYATPLTFGQWRSVPTTLGPITVSDVRDVTFLVELNPAPRISGMPTAGLTIWPPNRQLVTVATVSLADPAQGVVSFDVTGTSNEPARNPNEPDIVIEGTGTGPRTVKLRADRIGSGNGRVYTLMATAMNNVGKTTVVTSTCIVSRTR